MTLTVILKICLIWLAILVLAVLNGGLREAVLMKHLDLTTAQLISGGLLCAAILLMALWLVPWLGIYDARSLWLVGVVWLVLTLVFEFSFGLARGLNWSQMLAAYTFKDGNLWPLCLLITLTAPWLVGWYRGWFN